MGQWMIFIIGASIILLADRIGNRVCKRYPAGIFFGLTMLIGFVILVSSAFCHAIVYDFQFNANINNLTRAATINSNLTKWTTNFALSIDKYTYDIFANSATIKFDGRFITKQKQMDIFKTIQVATTAWNSNFLTGSEIWIHDCYNDGVPGTCKPCSAIRLWNK